MAKTHFGILELDTETTLPNLRSSKRGLGFEGTTLKKWTGSAWTAISGGGGGFTTWDELYSADKTLTIDSTTLTYALTHATGDGLTITGSAGSAGQLLQFSNGGSGLDIQGTSDTWSISSAGAAIVVGITNTGDITTTGASIDWDLKDNDSGALSIDAAGAAGLIAVDTTNASEGVTMSGTLTVAGALVASTGVSSSDGTCTFTDNSNAANGLVFVNDTVTTYGNASDAGPVHFSSASLTTGFLQTLSLDESELSGGGFLRCWEQDGGVAVFTVGEKGATVIAGSAAGTDAFTITVGDILINDSDQNIIESEDGTTTTVLIDNKAGVIASDSAVLSLDAGGAVASGGNILRVAPTGTPNAGAIGIEFVGAGKALTALYIDADPTGSDVATIHGGGVLTSDNAVLTVSSDGALATGSNTFRVDTTGTPASGAIYAEFDFAGLTDTNENIGVKIDAGGKKVVGLHIDADPTAGDVAYFHTDGATADNKAVLSLSSAGTPAAAGSNVLRVAFTGTDTNKPTLVEVIGAGKDCQGLSIDCDPTTTSGNYLTTGGVLAADKATLELVSSVAACNADSQVLRVQQGSATGANVTLGLLQADVSEPIALFESTAGSGNCVDLTNTTTAGVAGSILISVNGTDYRLEVHTAAGWS